MASKKKPQLASRGARLGERLSRQHGAHQPLTGAAKSKGHASKKSDGPLPKAGTPSGQSAPPPEPGDRVVEADFLAGATAVEQFPPPAFSEIAFAGRSNVGKSSLLNCLTSRKNLVRTSGTPGCTRQVAWFSTLSDDKARIDLVDLPGYGYARRSKTERKQWGDLIEGYLMQRPNLKGVVVLLDVRRGAEEDDLELLNMLRDTPRVSRSPLEITLVATKLDKLSPAAQKPALRKLQAQLGLSVLGFSSVTGIGRVPLWRKLRRIAGVALPELPGPIHEQQDGSLDR